MHERPPPKKQNRTIAFRTAPQIAPLLLLVQHDDASSLTTTIAVSHNAATGVVTVSMQQHSQQQQEERVHLCALRPGQGDANRGLLFPIEEKTGGGGGDDGAVRHAAARRAAAAVRGRMEEGGWVGGVGGVVRSVGARSPRKERIHSKHVNTHIAAGKEAEYEEVGHVLDYFFHGVLAPAVLLFLPQTTDACSPSSSSSASSSSSMARALFEAVTASTEGDATVR